MSNDEPTLAPPATLRGPGRPKLREERVVPRNVALTPSEWQQLEVLGQGSPSHGARRALELARAWLKYLSTPE